MSRTLPLALIALLAAAPALALEEGSYPVTTDGGGGEIVVTDRWLSLAMTGADDCTAIGEGPVLRGHAGAWAALFRTGDEQCVLVGEPAGFSSVGSGCAELVTGSCTISGLIDQARASRPVSVIPPLLSGRFNRLGEGDRRAVQSRLAELGLYEGAIDGAYGAGTESALIGHLQAMADRGEPVDGNSSSFIREMITALVEGGRAQAATDQTPAPAAPAEGSEGPIFVGTWSCGGQTYALTADRYRMINEYDGSVIQEGRLRADQVAGRTAYLELVGYGNLTFDGVGTRDMVMHDPSTGETWDCAPR
jgi:hypothetical protein